MTIISIEKEKYLFVPQDKILKLHYDLWDIVVTNIIFEVNEIIDIKKMIWETIDNPYFSIHDYISKKKEEALDFMVYNLKITEEERDIVKEHNSCFLCAYYLNNINYGESFICEFCDKFITNSGPSCLGGLYWELGNTLNVYELIEKCKAIRDFAIEE